jgi:hypothetical protein
VPVLDVVLLGIVQEGNAQLGHRGAGIGETLGGLTRERIQREAGRASGDDLAILAAGIVGAEGSQVEVFPGDGHHGLTGGFMQPVGGD